MQLWQCPANRGLRALCHRFVVCNSVASSFDICLSVCSLLSFVRILAAVVHLLQCSIGVQQCAAVVHVYPVCSCAPVVYNVQRLRRYGMTAADIGASETGCINAHEAALAYVLNELRIPPHRVILFGE